MNHETKILLFGSKITFIGVLKFWTIAKGAIPFFCILAGAILLIFLLSKYSPLGEGLIYGVVGLAATIAVGWTQYLLTEVQADFPIEKLENFEQVFRRSLNLLKKLEESEGRSFYMVAASPAFGLELEGKIRKQWEQTLRRCVVDGKDINMLFLTALPDQIGSSPLSRFCDALSKERSKTGSGSNGRISDSEIQKQSKKFFSRALDSMEFFAEFVNLDRLTSSTIKVGGQPPFQVVLLYDPIKEEGEGVVYFSSSDSISRGLAMGGFFSDDQRVVNIFREIFIFFEKKHHPKTVTEMFRELKTSENSNG